MQTDYNPTSPAAQEVKLIASYEAMTEDQRQQLYNQASKEEKQTFDVYIFMRRYGHHFKNLNN